MLLYGDYHTHTIFSHGKGRVEDNVRTAKEMGLVQIAITDHGLKHIAFGLKKRKMPKYTQEIKEAREKYLFDVLKGVEANIISIDGQIDMTDEEMEQFDIILCGYHKFIRPKSLKDFLVFLENTNLSFCNLEIPTKGIFIKCLDKKLKI